MTTSSSIVKPSKLSHGTLLCADMKLSRRFYQELLGLEVVRHAPSAMMVRFQDGIHIVCVEVGPEKLWNMHVLLHWGLDVATREEVDEAHRKALALQEEYGIQKIMKPVSQHGVYSFYLQDRDNNWWEIQHAPQQHESCFARGDVVSMDAGAQVPRSDEASSGEDQPYLTSP